jgi:2-iminoacetate synthase ThiH
VLWADNHQLLPEEEFEDDDSFYDPKNEDEYVCEEEAEDRRESKYDRDTDTYDENYNLYYKA